ncbi:hypothetical protein [Thioclava sp.]|uniref:hypothetical protein n=1 Tax=Thioclava sp. TaxID=1933450 RepID=UPI003AA9987A
MAEWAVIECRGFNNTPVGEVVDNHVNEFCLLAVQAPHCQKVVESSLGGCAVEADEAALADLGVAAIASGMPGFAKTLDEGENVDILAFIRSTWHDRMQAVQEERDAR